MLAKSLAILAQADAAGIVLGAKVPIILTSRADSVMGAPGVVRGGGAGRPGAAARRRQGDRLRDDADGRRDPGPERRLVEHQVLACSRRAARTWRWSPAARSRASAPRRASSRRTRAAQPLARSAGRAGEPLGHDGAFAHIAGWLRAARAAAASPGRGRSPRRPRRRARTSTPTARRRDLAREGGEAGAARAAAPAPQPRRDPRRARARAPSCRRSRASTPRCTGRSRASSRCSRCPRSWRTRACAATASTGCRTNTSPRCCRSTTRAPRAGRPWSSTSGSGASMCALDGRAQHRQHDELHRPRRAADGDAHGRARSRRHALPDERARDGRARDRDAGLQEVGPARRLGRVERHARPARVERAARRAGGRPVRLPDRARARLAGRRPRRPRRDRVHRRHRRTHAARPRAGLPAGGLARRRAGRDANAAGRPAHQHRREPARRPG